MSERKKLNPTRGLLKVGESVKCEYIGKYEKEGMNPETGEVTNFLVYKFKNLESGHDFTLRGSVGLRQALEDAMVEEGQAIEIVRQDDVKNAKGGSKSVYDIFSV